MSPEEQFSALCVRFNIKENGPGDVEGDVLRAVKEEIQRQISEFEAAAKQADEVNNSIMAAQLRGQAATLAETLVPLENPNAVNWNKVYHLIF